VRWRQEGKKEEEGILRYDYYYYFSTRCSVELTPHGHIQTLQLVCVEKGL
jgi:hypothetical protein